MWCHRQYLRQLNNKKNYAGRPDLIGTAFYLRTSTAKKYYERAIVLKVKPYLGDRMKVRACILMVLWTVLLIEPLSANLSIQSPYSCCAKEEKPKSSCSMSACDVPADTEEENDCGSNRCNPIMSCPTGNFYLFIQPHLSIPALNISTDKKSLVNDNRIVKQTGDCWHPPEII